MAHARIMSINSLSFYHEKEQPLNSGKIQTDLQEQSTCYARTTRY